MSPRAYRSETRAQQAAETRARIVDAARDLFATRGYQETSVADIAKASGVSAQTVHTHFGTKGGIIPALLTTMETEADAQAWGATIRDAATGPERLRAWAGWSVAMLAPAREVKEIMRAAGADPAMLELKRLGDERRREATRDLATGMHERGELRAGLTAEHAAEQLWLLTGLELYLAAADAGWDDARIAAWLGELLARALTEPQA